MHHIHTINQMIEKCAEYTQALHIAFMDYEKAFDSVETSAVIKALWNKGVDEHYARIIIINNIIRLSTPTAGQKTLAWISNYRDPVLTATNLSP